MGGAPYDADMWTPANVTAGSAAPSGPQQPSDRMSNHLLRWSGTGAATGAALGLLFGLMLDQLILGVAIGLVIGGLAGVLGERFHGA